MTRLLGTGQFALLPRGWSLASPLNLSPWDALKLLAEQRPTARFAPILSSLRPPAHADGRTRRRRRRRERLRRRRPSSTAQVTITTANRASRATRIRTSGRITGTTEAAPRLPALLAGWHQPTNGRADGTSCSASHSAAAAPSTSACHGMPDTMHRAAAASAPTNSADEPGPLDGRPRPARPRSGHLSYARSPPPPHPVAPQRAQQEAAEENHQRGRDQRAQRHPEVDLAHCHPPHALLSRIQRLCSTDRGRLAARRTVRRRHRLPA